MAVLASFLRARCSNWLAGGGLLVLTLSAGLARPACAAQYNVGTGTGCTHSNLSDALIAAAGNPGLDTIHLLSGSTHQGQFLVAGPLTIEGGYASCTATTPTGFSSVVGDNANRALFVLVSNGAVVTLSRLQIHGGNVTGDGGGIYLTGQGSLLLSGTLVFSNTATGAGGGVYVNGASGLFVHLGGSSAITANSANRGGGLACSGATEIQLDQAELVGNNTATTDGGGVYLASSCALYSLAGGSFAGIAGNIAGNRGGGVYAETQANLNLDGSSRGLSALTGNQAVDGAGAYLTGVGTILRSYGGSITANTASSHGGGLFVDNGAGAYLTTGLNAFNGCTDMVRCSLLSANQAAIGGGLFVDHVSGVTLQATFVEHNTATLFSSVIGVAGGSSATFDSSVVAQNSGNEPFSADGTNTHLTLGNVTVAANTAIGPGLLGVGSGVTGIALFSSVFAQSGALFSRFPANLIPILDCLIADQAGFLATLPAQTVERALLVADPRLSDVAHGNYHLLSDSPAIDYCDTSQWNNDNGDMEVEARTVDDPRYPNQMPGGIRDLGADEFQPLFANGFESGDTSGWALTVP